MLTQRVPSYPLLSTWILRLHLRGRIVVPEAPACVAYSPSPTQSSPLKRFGCRRSRCSGWFAIVGQMARVSTSFVTSTARVPRSRTNDLPLLTLYLATNRSSHTTGAAHCQSTARYTTTSSCVRNSRTKHRSVLSLTARSSCIYTTRLALMSLPSLMVTSPSSSLTRTLASCTRRETRLASTPSTWAQAWTVRPGSPPRQSLLLRPDASMSPFSRPATTIRPTTATS
mmetsp:Transcript_44189/g.103348  ORF Transcript_44189/g.103348 Transcript_44189/m.103348 type:complete len:227 (-) Transcript_44189:1576-2256(-)